VANHFPATLTFAEVVIIRVQVERLGAADILFREYLPQWHVMNGSRISKDLLDEKIGHIRLTNWLAIKLNDTVGHTLNL
jgi:hypothetical protein